MSERLIMRKVREVLRLKFECGRSQREIALACRIGQSTVSEYITRALAAGLTWRDVAAISDVEVESRLFHQVGRNEPALRTPIDFEWVHREPRRSDVTLQLLWAEYHAGGRRADGSLPYQYSQFAISMGSGDRSSPSRCAKCTAPARRHSSTTRA